MRVSLTYVEIYVSDHNTNLLGFTQGIIMWLRYILSAKVKFYDY